MKALSLFGIVGICLMTAVPVWGGGGDVIINEIRIDQPGSDVDEYFELAGAPGTSLDGMTYLVIGDSSGGGSGVIDFAVDLTGNSIGSSGFFVAAEDGDLPGGGTVDLVTFLGFENSDNVTHMLVTGFSGAQGDDLDTDNDCVLDVMPWASVVDSIALLEEENPPSSTECHYGPPSVGPDGSFVPGQVYRCYPAGLWTIGSFGTGGDDTPGAQNIDCVVEPVEINELRIDQSGSDVDEYFELTGGAGASLDGLTYIVIGDSSGDSGVIEAVIDLTGSSIGSSGFFVAAEDSDVPGGGTVDLIANINFENSDNVTHMVVFGFTGEGGVDVDTDNDGVIDNPQWSSIVSCIALVETPDSGDLIYCDTTVGPDGSFVPAQAYRCHSDGDWTIGAFSLGVTDTPGTQNLDCPAGCGDPEAGDCFEATGSPACSNEDCCNAVCESDPFCCDEEWNEFCADAALVECRECGDCDAGDCFEANGTPYCASADCCSLVCDMNPACCEAGWDQACADMAVANCATLPEPGDLVFGLSRSCPSHSIELVRQSVAAEGLSGMQVPDFWVEARMQSMEFDNLEGVSHNAQGNLLGVVFGGEATGGSVWSFATCSPVFGGALIGDTQGLGGGGIDLTRLAGLSVSPDNDKIAVIGYDSTKVIVYDYTAGDCNGNGAALSNARQTDEILCLEDTQGTAWLNNNTVLAFSTTGEIFAVDADSMDADVITTVDTVAGCGPGFTDIEYAPDISPNVYAMYSAFSGGTINLLFVLDPSNNLALLGTFDYSASMNTTREIAFDVAGNLYATQFGSAIGVIVDAASLGSLADDVSIDWYTSDNFASFSGLDIAHGSTAVERTLIVKQGACPGPVNPNSNGVIPMLLVGDEDFDVNNVDLSSLELRRCDGAGGSATPLADHTEVEDLNHPFGGEVGCGGCACNDNQDSDGIGDLALKFRTDTTLAALGLTASDGVTTVELTGSMVDGSTFVARDCMVVVPPGSGQSNATMQSNVFDTFIDVTPLDLNVDSDGFADFSRSYVSGTIVTVTAPTNSQGRRFLRWSVDSVLQPIGVRTMEVTVGENTTLKAYYQRASRLRPHRPTEGSGDME